MFMLMHAFHSRRGPESDKPCLERSLAHGPYPKEPRTPILNPLRSPFSDLLTKYRITVHD